MLGLELEAQGRLLRFRDPATGLLIPILEESELARQEESRKRQAAEQECETEARMRRELEAQLAALRAELAQSAREPPPASPPPHD